MTETDGQTEATGNLRHWFERCLQQPATDRLAWLAKQDLPTPIRQRLLSMLDADADTGTSPGEPVREWFLSEQEEDWFDPKGLVGSSIGGFQIERLIGEGGMSCVYQASRIGADFDQRVALKVLRSGLHSRLEQRLFRRERQVLASLNHPHIARLIDGGLTERGEPFLVMELVDGVDILRHADTARLTPRARVLLLMETARAVDAAHQQLIVHRDIKPSNILVDRQQQVKLLDFGIAKLLDQDEIMTRTGAGMMTPAYAAPEQKLNQPVSTATDVFALGVVLWELLLGSRPDAHPNTQRPSELARLQATSVHTEHESRQLQRLLRGDLDNILMKALDPEPRLRYRDAGAFADDLQRFLDGQAVLAHPPSRWYRAQKFVQRHRGAVGLTALLTLGLMGSWGVALWQAGIAREQAIQAASQAARADAVKDFMLGIFSAAEARLPEPERPTVADLLAAASTELQHKQTLPAADQAALYFALAQVSTLVDDDAATLSSLDQVDRLIANDPSQQRLWLRAQAARADVLIRRDQIDAAAALLQPIRNDVRIESDAATIEGLLALTNLAQARGDFVVALAEASEAATIAPMVFQSDRPERLRPLTFLAGVQSRMGDQLAARHTMQTLVTAWQQQALPQDLEYSRQLAVLGIIDLQLGDAEPGINQLESAIALRRQIIAGPNRETASYLNSLAAAQRAQGQLADATASAEAALDMLQRLDGPDHREVLSTKLVLAGLLGEQQGPELAIPAYQAVLASCERAQLMSSEPDCAMAWNSLGNAYLRAGQLALALNATERSKSLRLAMLGANDPNYAMSLAGHAAVLTAMGQHQAALDEIDQALRIRADKGLSESFASGMIMASKARVLLRLQRGEAALATIRPVAAIYARNAPNHAARQFEWQAIQALAEWQLGQTELARTHAQSAFALNVKPALRDDSQWQPLRALLATSD
ncbi:serine/threonine-protein kinase [Ahniella affigens]|nr:serine/threonine-protein kinase [Ahniella affigens]